MNILITGVAGGIGSHLAKFLVDNGHVCDGIDDFSSGRFDNIKNINFRNLFDFDISDSNNFKLIDPKYDKIIHLAAISSVPFCESNKAEAINSNLIGTANVLEHARNYEHTHLIFGSTSAVYENNKEKILTEDLEISPDLIYPLSKKYCEDLINSFSKNYNLKACVLRFFNVLGSNQNFDRTSPPLLNYIVKKLLLGENPKFHDSGKQKRDFIFIDDILKLIELVLTNNVVGTFNACSGNDISVNQLFEKTKKIMKSNIEALYEDKNSMWDDYKDLFNVESSLNKDRVGNEVTKTSKGSFEKAKKEIGWEPSKEFDNLLEKTIMDISKEIKFHYDI